MRNDVNSGMLVSSLYSDSNWKEKSNYFKNLKSNPNMMINGDSA